MTKPLRCRYCKRNLLHPTRDPQRTSFLSATRDHVVAKSRGGNFTAWCCHQCNQLKASMTLIEWAKFMQRYPKWWEQFRTHGQLKRRLERENRFPFYVPPPPLCRGLMT